MTFKEELGVWIIVGVLCFVVGFVFGVIENAQNPKVYEAKWKAPPIEHCEKETWDRIREGCNGT